jgi:hypothetical protein
LAFTVGAWKGGILRFNADEEAEDEMDELRQQIGVSRRAAKQAKAQATAQKESRQDLQYRAKVIVVEILVR